MRSALTKTRKRHKGGSRRRRVIECRRPLPRGTDDGGDKLPHTLGFLTDDGGIRVRTEEDGGTPGVTKWMHHASPGRAGPVTTKVSAISSGVCNVLIGGIPVRVHTRPLIALRRRLTRSEQMPRPPARRLQQVRASTQSASSASSSRRLARRRVRLHFMSDFLSMLHHPRPGRAVSC